jgi:hypothetical protein
MLSHHSPLRRCLPTSNTLSILRECVNRGLCFNRLPVGRNLISGILEARHRFPTLAASQPMNQIFPIFSSRTTAAQSLRNTAVRDEVNNKLLFCSAAQVRWLISTTTMILLQRAHMKHIMLAMYWRWQLHSSGKLVGTHYLSDQKWTKVSMGQLQL